MTPPAALKWNFPPTAGGVEYGFNDSGKEFFTAGVLEHVVREIIQNSLDAKDPRHPDSPVVVRINKIELERDVINAKSLARHVSESLKATTEQGNEKGIRFCERALKVLKKSKIPVLVAVDENTTGLGGPRWARLVHEEGTTSKDGPAAGGSFGIGKNAPYAASELGLVCYSTHYPDRHRNEMFIARCKLVAHADPEDKNSQLQNIGFGTSGGFDGRRYLPVLGREIHEAFRLKKTGTGIFIMGFRGERDWEKTIMHSVARSFFAAIHDKKLSVQVGNSEITNETLNDHFDKEVGTFCLKIATGDEKMGNQVAYINRRGMLITAEKSFSKNPFSARIDIGRYVAVVWPADDATGARIREMEPPTHESIEYKRIGEPDRRKKTRDQLQDVSGRIRDHIRKRLDLETFGKKTELRELSDIIPYVSDPDMDNTDGDGKARDQLNATIEVRNIRTGKGIVQADEVEEEGDGDGGTKQPGGKGGGSRGDPSHPNTRKAVSNMRNVRVVLHGGGKTLRVAFDAKTGASKFVIKPAGEEYKDEPPIMVTAAKGVSGARSVEVLDKTTVRVNAEPASRVVLDVFPGELSEYTGYAIREYRTRRTAR